MGIEDFSHFISGDIFRTPTKGVPGAIDKQVALEAQSNTYIKYTCSCASSTGWHGDDEIGQLAQLRT